MNKNLDRLCSRLTGIPGQRLNHRHGTTGTDGCGLRSSNRCGTSGLHKSGRQRGKMRLLHREPSVPIPIHGKVCITSSPVRVLYLVPGLINLLEPNRTCKQKIPPGGNAGTRRSELGQASCLWPTHSWSVSIHQNNRASSTHHQNNLPDEDKVRHRLKETLTCHWTLIGPRHTLHFNNQMGNYIHLLNSADFISNINN